jgi:chloramphenicol 3-O-phosphotransferase
MRPAGPPGQIIFLNGTSSSGKTSIAEQLLLVLDRPFFHMSVDVINGLRAKRRTLDLDPEELAAVLARTRAGFHRAVAGMAQAGNDLVVDYVLSEPWRLLDCLDVLADLDVVLVGCTAPPRNWNAGNASGATGRSGRPRPRSGRYTRMATTTSNARPPKSPRASAHWPSKPHSPGSRPSEPLITAGPDFAPGRRDGAAPPVWTVSTRAHTGNIDIYLAICGQGLLLP